MMMRAFRALPVYEHDRNAPTLTSCAAATSQNEVFLGTKAGSLLLLQLPQRLHAETLVRRSAIVAQRQVFPLGAPGPKLLLRTAHRATDIIQIVARGCPGAMTETEVLVLSAGGDVAMCDTRSWTRDITDRSATDAPDAALESHSVRGILPLPQMAEAKQVAKHTFAVALNQSAKDSSTILLGQRRRLLMLERSAVAAVGERFGDWLPAKEFPIAGENYTDLLWLGDHVVMSGASTVAVINLKTQQTTELPFVAKNAPAIPPKVVIGNLPDEIFITTFDSNGGVMGLFLDVQTAQTAPKPLFCAANQTFTHLERGGSYIAAANRADELVLLTTSGSEGASICQSVSLPAPVTAISCCSGGEGGTAAFVVCTVSTVWFFLPVPWTEQISRLTVENRFASAVQQVCSSYAPRDRPQYFRLIYELAFWRWLSASQFSLAFQALQLCENQLNVLMKILPLWRNCFSLPAAVAELLLPEEDGSLFPADDDGEDASDSRLQKDAKKPTNWRDVSRAYGEYLVQQQNLSNFDLGRALDATTHFHNLQRHCEAAASSTTQQAASKESIDLDTKLKLMPNLHQTTIESLAVTHSGDEMLFRQHAHREFALYLLTLRNSLVPIAWGSQAVLTTGFDADAGALNMDASDDLTTSASVAALADISDRLFKTGGSHYSHALSPLRIQLQFLLFFLDALLVRLSISLEELVPTATLDSVKCLVSPPPGHLAPHTQLSCFTLELIPDPMLSLAAAVVNVVATTPCCRAWRRRLPFSTTSSSSQSRSTEPLSSDSWLLPIQADPSVALRGATVAVQKQSSTEVLWALQLANSLGDFPQTVMVFSENASRLTAPSVVRAGCTALLNMCCQCDTCESASGPQSELVNLVRTGVEALLQSKDSAFVLAFLLALTVGVPSVSAHWRGAQRVELLRSDGSPLLRPEEVLEAVEAAVVGEGTETTVASKADCILQFLVLLRAASAAPGKARGGPELSPPMLTRLLQLALTAVAKGDTRSVTEAYVVTLMQTDASRIEWNNLQVPILLALPRALHTVYVAGFPAALEELLSTNTSDDAAMIPRQDGGKNLPPPNRLLLAEALCQAANYGLLEKLGPPIFPNIGLPLPPSLRIAPLSGLVPDTFEASFWVKLAVDWRMPALQRTAHVLAQRLHALRRFWSEGPAAAADDMLLESPPRGFDVLAGQPIDTPRSVGAVRHYIAALAKAVSRSSRSNADDGEFTPPPVVLHALSKYASHPDITTSALLELLPAEWPANEALLALLVKCASSHAAALVDGNVLNRLSALLFLRTQAALVAAKSPYFVVSKDCVCSVCSKRVAHAAAGAAPAYAWDPASRKVLHVECSKTLTGDPQTANSGTI